MTEGLAELQIRMAFQEQALDELDAVITRQQRLLDRAEKEISLLQERLLELESMGGGGAGESAQDERPPHY